MANGVNKRRLVRRIERELVVFDRAQVAEALAEAAPHISPWFLDRQYVGLQLPVWSDVIRYTGVDKGKYVAERRDCDDFAKMFAAVCSHKLGVNGVGLVIDISAAHAYNAVLVVSGTGELMVKFLEPQTDRWVFPGDPGYALQAGVVVF